MIGTISDNRLALDGQQFDSDYLSSFTMDLMTDREYRLQMGRRRFSLDVEFPCLEGHWLHIAKKYGEHRYLGYLHC